MLFAVVFAAMSVGLMTWGVDDWAQSQKALVEVGSAVVGLLAPLCVERVREWTKDREKAEGAAESPYPPNPAGLLRADQRIVPFAGRDDEYRELREWCRDVKSPVRLVVGAGGVGKTRLALELGDHLASVGWSVTVVAAGREADALTTLRAATRHSSILLIVNYAETRTDLAELLRSVARHPAHVRVLLIARSAGDWWWQLGSDVPAVRELVEAYPPLELSARVDSAGSPAELVHAAVPHFAAALGVPAPKVEITVPGEVPLLVLHAAALLAVLRSQDHPAPTGAPVADLDVLKDLLGHERRFWVHSAEQATLDLGPVVLRRAVAVACLFGAVNERDGAEILRRVPDPARR